MEIAGGNTQNDTVTGKDKETVKQFRVSISRVDLKYGNYDNGKATLVREIPATSDQFYQPAVALLSEMYDKGHSA